MFKKKPFFNYEPATNLYSNIFSLAKNHIPGWYKEIPKWVDKEMFKDGVGFRPTVKQCMPFLDSLTSGYMICLPNDLYIRNDNGVPLITWKHSDFPPKFRGKQPNLNLVPLAHSPNEFTWQSGVAISVPLGYSMLITHPINRYDLPFTTITGIVDGGLIMNPGGNIPFYIKEGFEGIIPQGTPIMQIIPFPQTNWVSKKTKNLVDKSQKHNLQGMSVVSGWYKKTFWTRKKYD